MRRDTDRYSGRRGKGQRLQKQERVNPHFEKGYTASTSVSSEHSYVQLKTINNLDPLLISALLLYSMYTQATEESSSDSDLEKRVA